MKKLLAMLLLLLPFRTQAQNPFDSTTVPQIVIPKLQFIPVIRPFDTLIRFPGPYGKVSRFSPPLIYKKWWKEVEACSKLSIPSSQEDKVSWFYVTDTAFLVGDSTGSSDAVGVTLPWHDIIYLIFNGITDPRLVKHEMLHYLMYQNGLQAGHPTKLFVTQCHLVSS